MAAEPDENFGLRGPALDSNPSGGAVAVTKSDTNDIWGVAYTPRARPCRGIYVGGTGDIKMTMADGTVVTRIAVPVGEWPWRIKQIWSAGTSATNIIADY